MASIIGAAAAWALSIYTGPSLWGPAIVSGVTLTIFNNTFFRPRYFPGALAILIGHLAWILSAVTSTGTWSPFIYELFMMTAGVLWLWKRPGIASAGAVGAYELLGIIANFAQISTFAFGSDEHKSLTVHCLLRILAMSALAVGYWRFYEMNDGRANVASRAGTRPR